MRITGGEWASRRALGPPAGSPLRPTPDALREQAFAVLAPALEGAVFLDLFAGTGVVSLEALSRGAARVILVDRARQALALARRNLASLAVAHDRFEVLPVAARQAVAVLARRRVRCDLAWCDPPFGIWREGVEALAAALAARVLAPGARVVLEVPPRQEVAIAGFEVRRELRGAVLLEVAEP